jgi:hypothetical protein
MAPASLLTLPREVSDQIWSNLSEFPTSMHILHPAPSDPANWQLRNDVIPRQLSAVCLTCTFLYHELLTYHYSNTTLSFSNTEALHNFLKRIGPTARTYVRKVHIYWFGSFRRLTFELLAESRSLLELWVGVSRDTMCGGMERQPLASAWGKIGLEKIRCAEGAGEKFDFKVREVDWEVWHAVRDGRREYIELFEKEIVEGIQPWGRRAYFGNGVVANFEKQMREMMTTPRIEEVSEEEDSSAGEGNKDQADEGEEQEGKEVTDSSATTSKEVEGAKERNRSPSIVSEEHPNRSPNEHKDATGSDAGARTKRVREE